MSLPDTEHVKKMVAELDAAVPRDGARVCLSQYGGAPDESEVIANQRGYLRLGIEFLRAAFAPASPKSKDQIQADVYYLLTNDSTIGFDRFERREDLTGGTHIERKPGRFVPAFIVFVLIVGLILAIIGLGTVIVWMTR